MSTHSKNHAYQIDPFDMLRGMKVQFIHRTPFSGLNFWNVLPTIICWNCNSYDENAKVAEIVRKLQIKYLLMPMRKCWQNMTVTHNDYGCTLLSLKYRNLDNVNQLTDFSVVEHPRYSFRVVTVRFGSVLQGPGTEPDRRRRNRNRTVRNFVEPNRTEPNPNRK